MSSRHAAEPGAGAVHPAVPAVLGHRRPARRQVREVAPHPLIKVARDRDHGARRASGFFMHEPRRCCSPRCSWAACTRRCSARSSSRSCRSTCKPSRAGRRQRLVEMGTFVAILLGTIARRLARSRQAGLGRRRRRGRAPARCRAAGSCSRASSRTRRRPTRSSRSTGTRSPRPGATCSFAHGNRTVFLSMLGISWFWFFGAMFLTQFPTSRKNVLGGDEHVVTLLLVVFSVGIGVGSLLCERLSGPQGRDRPGAVRLDRPDAVRDRPVLRQPRRCTPRGSPASRVPARARRTGASLADLVLIGVFGGFYIVPLYALIQSRSEPSAPLAHHRRATTS